ncbi:AI-2E family transporter [Actinomadura pelletieri]|uniref:AI-2E family transporter n=1 Tax=Actinomadura pelletieri TaxID=111805 RepID=UPI001FE4CEE6|nr:AI-2E family transporter [Actinomadura pelletieri]
MPDETANDKGAQARADDARPATDGRVPAPTPPADDTETADSATDAPGTEALEADADTDPHSRTEPGRTGKAATEPVRDPAEEPVADSDTDTEPHSRTQQGRTGKAATEPVRDSAEEPAAGSDTDAEPHGRTQPGRTGEAAPEPVRDPVEEPVADSATDAPEAAATDTDADTEPHGRTQPGRTGKAATEPVRDPAEEPAAGSDTDTEPHGRTAPGRTGEAAVGADEESEEAVADSGALIPEETDEPVGERDPATGGPVNLPAEPPAGGRLVRERLTRRRVAHEPEAPDPAHDVEQRRREAGVDHRFPFGRPGEPLGRAHPFVFGFTAALGVITAWMLVQAATNAKSVIVMIVVAMFLAVGLNPAVERLRRFGLPRGAAVATVFMGVILFFAGFVASLVQPVSEQVTELRTKIPEFVGQLQDNKTLADWDKRYGLLERAEKTVNSDGFQDGLTDIATGIGKVAVNGVFQTITILILTLYFMSSLPQIKTFFYQLAPRSRRARVALLGDEILDRIGGYVAGQFTIAFIAGTTSYVFLSIVGVKYALALALIVAVTDLIPLIGATIGAVVVCLLAFLTGNLTDLIICAVFYLIYQQVENYVVYPRVMKRTVDVQPAVTIVAALIGGTLLGVVGALLAIPTAAAISLLIREVVMPRQETM